MTRRTLNIERSQKGFTSVELIIVMLVLGMLTASFVIKNPFTTGDYSTIAADQLIADIRYVQMRAMGVGGSQNIFFTNGSGTYSIRDASNNVIEQKNLPGKITVASTTFGNTLSFNSLGEPNIGTTNRSITLSAGSPITITAITGSAQ